MEQFPDDSPLARLRLLIDIILGVFLSLDATVGTGTAVSGTVTRRARIVKCNDSGTSIDERRRRRGSRRIDPARAARRGHITASSIPRGSDDGL
jgi:hypothetical protein